MNVMVELRKEERVNSLLNFVISYIDDLCAETPEDEDVRVLKEDIEYAYDNYKCALKNPEENLEEENNLEEAEQQT